MTTPTADISRMVVHCKRAPYDVYIGRPSKWGNPFSHELKSDAPIYCTSRAEAVLCYDQWINGGQQELHDRVKLVRPTIEEIRAELRGKVLGCWCAPQACHGDILARLANS